MQGVFCCGGFAGRVQACVQSQGACAERKPQSFATNLCVVLELVQLVSPQPPRKRNTDNASVRSVQFAGLKPKRSAVALAAAAPGVRRT